MPEQRALDAAGFHWMLEMFQNIDVGLVVLDRDYRVQVWNGFMENHSGMRPDQVTGHSCSSCFPTFRPTG